MRAREVLARIDDSPERQDALRLLADKLDLPKRDTCRACATKGRGRSDAHRGSLAEGAAKGDRLEREALAACLMQPALVKLLAELSPEHFDAELHRRFRALLIG